MSSTSSQSSTGHINYTRDNEYDKVEGSTPKSLWDKASGHKVAMFVGAAVLFALFAVGISVEIAGAAAGFVSGAADLTDHIVH